MSPSTAIRGVVFAVLLAWLLFLLARKPKNIPLRALTILVACWAAAWPVDAVSDYGRSLFGDELTVHCYSYLSIMAGDFSLLCFFLYTLYDARRAGRYARLQAVPFAVAVVGLVGLTIAVPTELRDPVAELVGQTISGVAHPPVSLGGVFNAIPNTYSLYIFACACVVMGRYARSGADRLLRHGMVLATIGAVLLVFAFSTFIASNASSIADRSFVIPRPVVTAGVFAMLTGIPVFLIGLCYKSARMRLGALRVWGRHRKAYRQLQPLWDALHRQFPEDALSRVPPNPWRDTFAVTEVHRRFYRRLVECRDGLVRISPYVAQIRDDTPAIEAQPLVVQLVAAFELRASGTPVVRPAVRVAMPDDRGLDADTAALVSLSRDLRRNGFPSS